MLPFSTASHYRSHVYEQRPDLAAPESPAEDRRNAIRAQDLSVLQPIRKRTVVSSASGTRTWIKNKNNARPAPYKFKAPKSRHAEPTDFKIPELQYHPVATSFNIVPITSQLRKFRYVVPEEQMRSSFGIVNANYDQFEPAFKEDKQSYPHRYTVVYLLLPRAGVHQPFAIVIPKIENHTNYDPVEDFYATIRACFSLIPSFEADKIEDFLDALDRSLKADKRQEFLAITGQMNEIFSSSAASEPSLEVIDNVVEQVYGKCASPCLQAMGHYTSFSKEVYGEFLPAFISEILEKVVTITPDSVVLDLGSGVGQVVMQIALTKLCAGYGIELRENLTEIAQDLLKQALLHAQLWGIAPGSMKVYSGDFTTDHRVPDLLLISDLVIVNNHEFPPDCLGFQ
ncbi:Nucleosomal histone H3-Lys79 methylase [Marasmius tenuissimus]|uniref:Histone-lysine N-methyltransferase, H3 lysine-79 specific n=1 Tax=Marasmius tenuissimus TaxID=585030 RepID=A0ABR2ZT55_9AGAR